MWPGMAMESLLGGGADRSGCAQAVIFLFEHSESGSAGLILNRRTSYNLGSLQGGDMLCPDFAGASQLFKYLFAISIIFT
jgi:hypothetical protein